MRTRTLFAALLMLSLAGTGCVHFKQPKEFKNRKSKEDPPILNQAPALPATPAFAQAGLARTGKGA